MNFDQAMAGRQAMEDAEAQGRVADSLEVRKALMQKFHDGEMTLEEVQSELKRIKRNAKRNGMVTYNQAFLGV